MEAQAKELARRYKREVDTIAWLFPDFWSELTAVLPDLGTQPRTRPEEKSTEGEAAATSLGLEIRTLAEPREESQTKQEGAARTSTMAATSPETREEGREHEDVPGKPTAGHTYDRRCEQPVPPEEIERYIDYLLARAETAAYTENPFENTPPDEIQETSQERGPAVEAAPGSRTRRVTKKVTFEITTEDHPPISAELARSPDSPYYRGGPSVIEKIQWPKAQTEEERRRVDKIIQARAEKLAEVLSRTRPDPDKCWNCGSMQHRFRHCPESRDRRLCYGCGRPGYTLRDCPVCEDEYRVFGRNRPDKPDRTRGTGPSSKDA